MRIACCLILMLCGACAKDPDPARRSPDWPRLPREKRQARELVDRYTRRPASGQQVPITAEGVLDLVRERIQQGRAIGGTQEMISWIAGRADSAQRAGQSAYILWGTYHDSGLQVRAFGDLVGPLGLPGLDAVAVEQFKADGHWAGPASAAQVGDSAAIAEYLKSGSPGALSTLQRSQLRENYTAWKYGILPVFLDLLYRARAAGRRLAGCDMTLELQELVRKTEMQDRLRELHCVLALQGEISAGPPPHRLAMLWGQGHLAPEGVQRFLPEGALVLSFYVFGGRFSQHGLERELGARLAVADPLLLPLDDQSTQLVVLLPDRQLGARKELKHQPPEFPLTEGERRRLVASSSTPGKLNVGGLAMPVGEEPKSVELEPGGHCFVFDGPHGLLAGAVVIPADGYLRLDLVPEERSIEVTLHRRAR